MEVYIRRDNYELTLSEAVRSDSIDTWVYFDARNYASSDGLYYDDGMPVIRRPLRNVFDENGDPLTEKHSGTRIMRWDHEAGQMRVVRTVKEEWNSDLPDSMQAFIQNALEGCYEKFGSDVETFLVFSSHGGGYMGFGRDLNIGEDRYLAPFAFNKFIVYAIEKSLNNTEGAPKKVDVLGFDACNMQAIGALDEYQKIARYMMASEAIIPGQGTLNRRLVVQ